MRPAALVAGLVLVVGAAAAGALFVLRDTEPDEPADVRGPGAPRRGTAQETPDPPPPDGATPFAPPTPQLPVVARDAPIPELPPDPQPGASLRYQFGPFAAEATRVDWRRVGIRCRQSRRDLLAIAKKIHDTGDAEPHRIARFDAFLQPAREAQPIVAAGLRMKRVEMGVLPEAAVPPNPVFEANALAATLDAWNRSLSPEQETKVGELFIAHQRAFDGLAAGEGDPWKVSDLVALTRARAELQGPLEAILGDAQRAALWPPELKGRVGLDLFSATAVWHERVVLAQVVEHVDPVEGILDALRPTLHLAGKADDDARDALRAWLPGLPASWRDRGVRTPASRAGFVSEAELYPAMDRWQALLDDIRARSAAAGRAVPEIPGGRKIVLVARVSR